MTAKHRGIVSDWRKRPKTRARMSVLRKRTTQLGFRIARQKAAFCFVFSHSRALLVVGFSHTRRRPELIQLRYYSKLLLYYLASKKTIFEKKNTLFIIHARYHPFAHFPARPRETRRRDHHHQYQTKYSVRAISGGAYRPFLSFHSHNCAAAKCCCCC